MGKRLDDISAVQSMVPYETQSEHYSRTVRKIDNGYITHYHQYGPNAPDGPTSREVFTRSHPDQSDAGEMGRNGTAMKRAVDHLKKC